MEWNGKKDAAIQFELGRLLFTFWKVYDVWFMVFGVHVNCESIY